VKHPVPIHSFLLPPRKVSFDRPNFPADVFWCPLFCLTTYNFFFHWYKAGWAVMRHSAAPLKTEWKDSRKKRNKECIRLSLPAARAVEIFLIKSFTSVKIYEDAPLKKSRNISWPDIHLSTLHLFYWAVKCVWKQKREEKWLTLQPSTQFLIWDDERYFHLRIWSVSVLFYASVSQWDLPCLGMRRGYAARHTSLCHCFWLQDRARLGS